MSFSNSSTEFNFPRLNSLPEAIADLEDNSAIFVRRVLVRDFERATKISVAAVKNLDFIANELFREKTNLQTIGKYKNSDFENRTTRSFGKGVEKVARTDQEDVIRRGGGNGRVPVGVGVECKNLTLVRIINKIKHRHKTMMNFRLEDNKHIFVVCTEGTDGGAEGIYEFDLIEFCELCRSTYFNIR